MGRRDEEPIRRKKALPGWALALLIAAAVGVPLVCGGGLVMAAVAWFGVKPVSFADRTYPTVTADDLMGEWAKNPAAAADKYERSGATVRGVLSRVSSNIHDETYIEVGGFNATNDVWPPTMHVFVTSPAANEDLKKCKVGDAIVVRCVGTGQVQEQPWMSAEQIRRDK